MDGQSVDGFAFRCVLANVSAAVPCLLRSGSGVLDDE